MLSLQVTPMAVKFIPADRQRIADFLFDVLVSGETAMQPAIDRLVERLSIDPESAMGMGSNSARNNFRALIMNVNGTDKILEVISDIAENKLSAKQVNGDVKFLRDLLSPHGYIAEVQGGRVVVQPTGQVPTPALPVKNTATWLDTHATPDTTKFLSKARARPGKSEWKDMLSDSRNAMEGLATTKFDEALQELINEGLIEQGDNTRKKDAELLRAIYGFDSTFGAHAGGSVEMQEIRAELGYHATVNAVVFLIRTIEAGRKHGKKLLKWK